MAKKKKSSDSGDEGGALLQMMTVSLFIILLAFFILLNSIARESEDRKLIALGSLARTFNILSGGYSLFRGSDEEAMLDNISINTREIDFSELFIKDTHLTQHIRIRPHKKGSVVRIPAYMLFDATDMEIKSEGYETLDHLCKIAQKNEHPIDIIGHTQNMSIDTTKRISNREFSVMRALSVLNYFIEKGNIDPKRLTTFGWGKYRPIGSNRTLKTRQMNQRIDFVFTHKKERKKPKGIFTFKDFLFKTVE